MTLQLFDSTISFDEDRTDATDPKLTIHRVQQFPEGYIDNLLKEKIDPANAREGELMRFASIPIEVVEQWDREGFHIEHESAHAICARLNNEGLDAFITTRKRI